MKSQVCVATFALFLSASAMATEPVAMPAASNQERIDMLIKQNLLLSEENARLRAFVDRPKTSEEVFAMCMQATKGQGAMAASSIGGHCIQILKK